VRLRCEDALAADAVDRLVARRRDEPGARVVRQPGDRPSLGGDGERLLRGFLCAVEVAEETDQGSDDAPPFVPEDLLRQCSTRGRTSIAP
jgi:hypothetical protein